MRSLSIEQDIIRKVQQGDVDGLIDGATKIPAVRSGQLAPQLLRHHRNFFIRLETIVSRAAIQAGLPAEEVLETEEHYISKCESLPDMERIKNLQYHMILNYADQVRKLKHPIGAKCVAVHPQPYGRTDPHRRHCSILRQKPRQTDYGIQKANRQDAV